MKALGSARIKKFLFELGDLSSRVLLKHYQKVKKIERKPGAGIVTEADKEAEAVIIRKILKSYPDSCIITEETGTHGHNTDLQWVVDPLDGTTNYAHGFPWFCVSIALVERGITRAGLIHHPLTRERFYAEKGRGAFLNGKKIRVSSTSQLADALLGTGFYYNTGSQLAEEIEIFRRVQDQALGVRRPGSAALDLAYVACGRYDGFWERGLSCWDVAAGFLLVTEAGGKVTDYRGAPTSIHDREVVATNSRLHPRILKLLVG